MRTKYDSINKNEGGFAYKDHSRDWHMLNFGEEIPFGTELTHCETYNTVCVIVQYKRGKNIDLMNSPQVSKMYMIS